ncbi:MAG: ABC transporter ATP-binding protein [Rhodanobacteraceae bacterium]
MKLAIEQVQTRRGSFAVGPVTAQLAPGGCLALMGANGAGKTTVLETLAGFFQPATGRVLLDGKDLTNVVPERRHFAYLPQDLALFPHLNVVQNVAFAARQRNSTRGRHAVAALLEEFDLGALATHQPRQLSRGQAQRVALARALAAEPALLLLDEPTASLDIAGRRSFNGHLQRLLRERRLMVIYATHNVVDSLSLATQLIVLHAGKVVQAGTPGSLFEVPANAYVAELLGITNLWPVDAVDVSGEAATVHLAGHALACTQQPVPSRVAFAAIGPGEVEVFGAAPADATNCFEAVVQALQVSGESALVDLGCSLARLRAAVPPWRASEMAPGKKLWIRLPANRLRLIAGSGPQRGVRDA